MDTEKTIPKPIINVKNLKKVYHIGSERVVALDCINFSVLPGQIVCIVGTSGSGKSTLLNQLAGLEKPTGGGVYIGKHNISKFSENQLAKFRQKYIGFVFQSYNLIGSNTALENVAMPLMFRGVERKKREKMAQDILKAVGLGGRMRHRPSEMSGGQQQRVGIARAFVSKPKVIFADEPTGNLDTRTTLEVMEMMVKMSRDDGLTLLMVTHNQYLAQYADRIITLIDGNVVSDILNVSIVDRKNKEEIIENYIRDMELKSDNIEEPQADPDPDIGTRDTEPEPDLNEPQVTREAVAGGDTPRPADESPPDPEQTHRDIPSEIPAPEQAEPEKNREDMKHEEV